MACLEVLLVVPGRGEVAERSTHRGSGSRSTPPSGSTLRYSLARYCTDCLKSICLSVRLCMSLILLCPSLDWAWMLPKHENSTWTCSQDSVKTFGKPMPFRVAFLPSLQDYSAGIFLTTFPSFRACTLSFSKRGESAQRSGGARLFVAQ